MILISFGSSVSRNTQMLFNEAEGKHEFFSNKTNKQIDVIPFQRGRRWEVDEQGLPRDRNRRIKSFTGLLAFFEIVVCCLQSSYGHSVRLFCVSLIKNQTMIVICCGLRNMKFLHQFELQIHKHADEDSL